MQYVRIPFFMTFLKHLIASIFLILTVALPASCQINTPTSPNHSIDSTGRKLYLSPQDFWDSLPEPVGYVNDYENLYTDSEEKTLDSLIAGFERKTTIQIALITFDTTMTTKDSLEALTLRIANVWGVGQKDKNNGVTIGICRGYRKMRIQNGDGIEKILTDRETKEIIDTAFIPSFKDGKYFEGTLIGVKTLIATLGKNAEKKSLK